MTTGLLLSLFPGIDLFGRAFESEGFCVVRGPDLLWGGDIRDFHPPADTFEGIIGGSPCQDFSGLRRDPPTGEGVEMLAHFARCVTEARPVWWLLENVPRVPHLEIPGYSVQRFNLDARECGSAQSRLRKFQFGHVEGRVIVPLRSSPPQDQSQPCCLASEGQQARRRAWADFCALQGLPRDFHLPGLSKAACYRAVGNGVPLPMGRVIARAIVTARGVTVGAESLCICGCARRIAGRQRMATAACRKRMERARKCVASMPSPAWPVTLPYIHSSSCGDSGRSAQNSAAASALTSSR